MRCAIHVDALLSLFNGNANVTLSAMIGAGIIGVTDNILSEYNDKLNKNTVFTAWFAALQSNRRLTFISTQQKSEYPFPSLRSIHKDYLIAAYYSGMDFFFSQQQNMASKDHAELVKWGIRKTALESCLHQLSVNYFGDNPINELNLKPKGHISPNALSCYCTKEKTLVVYDKYINSNALSFILTCCKELQNNAHVYVLTSSKGSHCNSPLQIEQAIKSVLPRANIKCGYAHKNTISELHDRYLFIGERIQIRATRGLDGFGQEINNQYQNKDGVDSTGRCNAFPQPISWSFEAQGFSGALIEL